MHTMHTPLSRSNGELFHLLAWAFCQYNPATWPDIARKARRDLVIEIMTKLNSIDLDAQTKNRIDGFLDGVRIDNRPLYDQLKVIYQNGDVIEHGDYTKANAALYELIVSAYGRYSAAWLLSSPHKAAILRMLRSYCAIESDPRTQMKLAGFLEGMLLIDPRLHDDCEDTLLRHMS